MRAIVAVFALFFFAAPAAAQTGPSFDCTKAGTPVEHAICDHFLLSWLDTQLNELYGAARGQLSESDRNRLRDRQRAWLRDRNACGADYDCLATSYSGRLRELADIWDGDDATGVFQFVDFGFGGDMALASYPDGRVAAYIETINESRGHSCTVDFVGNLTEDGEVVWQDLEDQYGDGRFCKVTISLAPGQARVFPENCMAYCGMAGSFEGNYRLR